MRIASLNLWRSLLWLALGLLIGVAFGLFLGWVAWPAEFSETDPSFLDDSYQRDYALMIASAYSLDGDLPAAQRRLRGLGLEDSTGWLLLVTVDHILNSGDQIGSRHLARLASDLGLYSPAMDPYLPAESLEANGGT
jgi:hypothetical protein